MSTQQFDKMVVQPRDRTPIIIVRSSVKRHCHKCKRLVEPKLINTAFLSKPLEKCPECNSVIQGKAGAR